MKYDASDKFYIGRKPASIFDCLLEIIIRYFRFYHEKNKTCTSFHEHTIELLRGLFGPALTKNIVIGMYKSKDLYEKSLLKKIEKHFNEIEKTIINSIMEDEYNLSYTESDVTQLLLIDHLFDNIISSLHFLNILLCRGIQISVNKTTKKNPIKLCPHLMKLSNYVYFGCCNTPLDIVDMSFCDDNSIITTKLRCPVCNNSKELIIKVNVFKKEISKNGKTQSQITQTIKEKTSDFDDNIENQSLLFEEDELFEENRLSKENKDLKVDNVNKTTTKTGVQKREGEVNLNKEFSIKDENDQVLFEEIDINESLEEISLED